MQFTFISTFCILIFAVVNSTHQTSSNPVELGDVNWMRSLESAQEQSAKTEKPILILFQEIPGCATCRNYGNDVLTDPLIVEAIETYFVPLAIYNNKKGKDAEVLKLFGEPSWNNPVVRVVDRKLNGISKRLNANYTKAGLVEYMTSALIKHNGLAPKWLQLFADELSGLSRTPQTATYSMYCFWKGEAHFGRMNGVLETEPGFANGKEVVKVKFDPGLISKKVLDDYAQQAKCGIESKVNGYRADQTPKYYLSKSKYKHINLTELQKCRVNSAIAEGLDPSEFLSPRQLKMMGGGKS